MRTLPSLLPCVALLSSSWSVAAPAPAEETSSSAPTSQPGPDSAKPSPQRQEGIVPPKVIHRVEAKRPAEAPDQHRVVELKVTVATDGTVGEVTVARSGGAKFDQAATIAVQGWSFAAATRGGLPVNSRILVTFPFHPVTEAALLEVPALEAQGAASRGVTGTKTSGAQQPRTDKQPPVQTRPSAHAHYDPGAEEEALEVTVHGRRQPRSEHRTVSDFHVGRDVIKAAPRQEGAEALRSAPGLYLGRAEGAAVAHSYMLRGFDADHGQDIEFRVGGLPINLPSHIHGQGYADLGFLIGETVRDVHATEGVYDPRQGDFAVAGSVDVELGLEDDERGILLKSGAGRFDTYRELVLWAPEDEWNESFGAAQYTQTAGFGENRAGTSASAIVQHRFGEGASTTRAIAVMHSARSDLAGIVRQDDVENGQTCFLCVYPQATAQAQNAQNHRFLAGIFHDQGEDSGANAQYGLWLGVDSFRIQANYTGFIERSRTLAAESGRGDLIEQQNQTLSLGLSSRYRSAPYHPTDWLHGTVEVGVEGRIDSIDQTQNLLDASVRNQRWDQRVDAEIRSADLGLWGDLDWSFGPYVSWRGGLRGDVLSYEVDDHLGNFLAASRDTDSFIVGFQRSSLGLAWGPRTSLEIAPHELVSILAAYGEGYRSPQARSLEEGESAPFTKVRSADLGVHLDVEHRIHLALGGYLTQLSDDVAFDPGEGRLERIGATRRVGAVAHGYSRLGDWLVASASATWVRATLLEPPPATAEEPQPPFNKGQQLPFVPPLVLRADAGLSHGLHVRVDGKELLGRLGAGFSFLSPRPLPYGQYAKSVALLDASAALSWTRFDLSLEAFNMLNTEYATMEYNLVSDWTPSDGVQTRSPARHLAAGAPLSWMLTLGVQL